MHRVVALALFLTACNSVEVTMDAAVFDGTDDGGVIVPDDAAIIVSTADAAPGTLAANVPGKHLHTLAVAGETRKVIVYVPAKAAEGAAPVVFMLHGTSGDGERFYQISHWREKADETGLIAVFPTALVHCFFEDENLDGDFSDQGERKVSTKWADGKLGTDRMPLCGPDHLAQLPEGPRAAADHPLADDLAFTQAILDLLGNEYVVDPRRIYVSGFSNGGNMSARLAVEKSDQFAAAHVAAGALQVPVVPNRAIAVLFSVGALDDRFTIPMDVDAIPLDESLVDNPMWQIIAVDRFVPALQLAEAYEFDSFAIGGETIARYRYDDSLIGATNAYVAVVIEGLFHQYANGTNHAVVYADELWKFFQVYSLP